MPCCPHGITHRMFLPVIDVVYIVAKALTGAGNHITGNHITGNHITGNHITSPTNVGAPSLVAC